MKQSRTPQQKLVRRWLGRRVCLVTDEFEEYLRETELGRPGGDHSQLIEVITPPGACRPWGSELDQTG
jgi:hypothetical protein